MESDSLAGYSVIDNSRHNSMEKFLNEQLKFCDSLIFCVAFASMAGIKMLKKQIERLCRQNVKMEFLIGVDLFFTKPAALKYFYDLREDFSSVSLLIPIPRSSQDLFHPKFFLIESGSSFSGSIGSSNLTSGGLKTNTELNLGMYGEKWQHALQAINESYVQIRNTQTRVPNNEFLLLYEEAYRARTSKSRRIELGETSKLEKEFLEMVKRLPKPKTNVDDLRGWLKLVYEKAPFGNFKTRELYQMEDHFKSYYPENKHIREKIRQQLQILAKLGLIEDLGRGCWRKSNGSKETEDDL